MTIFFAADHHFQHAKLLTFKDANGNLLRPNFKDIQEHDNTIIARHNSIVKPDDLVYFLGDVTWKTNLIAKEILQAMNGRKRLIVGNHDDVDFLMGTGFFERTYLWKYFPEHNLIASHVPLTVADLKRAKFNVHGHLHDKVVTKPHVTLDDNLQPYETLLGPVTDMRYLNVGMERTGYKPFSLEEVLGMLYEDIIA